MSKMFMFALVLIPSFASAGYSPSSSSYAFNGSQGIYVGDSGGYGPTIGLSSNGGNTWSYTEPEWDEPIAYIGFNVAEIFESTIILAGLNGLVVRSTDRGSSWSALQLAIGDYRADFVISSFSSPDTGALLTSCGELWMKRNASSGFTASWSGVLDVDFGKAQAGTETAGWILEDFNVAVYEPGSGDWIYPGDPYSGNLPSGVRAKAICHIPSNPRLYAVVVGADGVILKTLDGGVTWTAIATPASDYTLYDVHFKTSSRGYAVGTKDFVNGQSKKRSVLLGTRDGGATWTKLMEKDTFSNSWKGFTISSSKLGYGIWTWDIIGSSVYYSNGYDYQVKNHTDQGNSTSNSLGLIYVDPNQKPITEAPVGSPN